MSNSARQSDSAPRRAALRLWLWWVMANAVASVVGAVVASGLSTLATALDGDLFPYPFLSLLLNVLQVPTIWIILSTAQWLVLRPHIKSSARASGVWWVLASVGGGIAAVVISFFTGVMAFLFVGGLSMIATSQSETTEASTSLLGRFIFYGAGSLAAFFMGVIAGSVIGGAQWTALQRYARGDAVWMWSGTNALGWGSGFAAVTLILHGSPISLTAILGTFDLPTGIIAGGIAITVASLITGIALTKIPAGDQPANQLS